MDHPNFLNNSLYIAGDSYSGIVLPIIVQEISDGTLLLYTLVSISYQEDIRVLENSLIQNIL